MAQRPDPLRKELTFFLRWLIKQERELQDVNKRSNRRDRSRETLEARMKTRKTQLRIDEIRSQMGKRGIDSRDSDGSTSRSTSRGPITPRPPKYPPSPLPPLLAEPTRHKRAGVIEKQTTGSSLRSVRRQRPGTTKDEGETHPRVARPPLVRSFRPTDIPSFEPSIPPPGRRDPVRDHTAPQRLTERESNRPQLRPAETFPR